MKAEPNLASQPQDLQRTAPNARCPHQVFHNVLGAQAVAGLLAYVTARQQDFQLGRSYNRITREGKVDANRRDCLMLGELGPFEAPIDNFVRSVSAGVLSQLHLDEPSVEPREFEFSAYGDGGHFNTHIDTIERLDRVRILSCVYYFAATPRRFSGGELRLHAFPAFPGQETAAPPFVDVVPETDTMVAFPSWMRHEVLPVRMPSGAWADRRFAINCWVHRVQAS